MNHPSTIRLVECATVEYPVGCGPTWDKEHIEIAILHGRYKSSLKLEVLNALHKEVIEEVEQGYAKIKFKDIKDNLPKKLKNLPVAMIQHKSRAYYTILDLLFKLRIDEK